MRRVDVERRAVAPDLLKRVPHVDHAPQVVGGEVALYEGGRPLLLLSSVAVPLGFRRACLAVEANTTFRTNGLKTTARAFGTLTRNVIRGDFCRGSSVATEHPAEHSALTAMGATLAEVYRAHAPDAYAAHAAAAEGVPRDFRLRDTPFTSGNLNKNSSLAYHLDKGNARDAWSAMVVVRERVTGGHLVLPEFGASLELVDGACLLFDGQSTWHGLTPVVAQPGGYRFSVVYFSLKAAWQCLPFTDELARIKAKNTERSRALLGRNVYAGKKPELKRLVRDRGAH
jgi:hypothetical protein